MSAGVRPLLSDYWECFDGIIPTPVVTASRDGTPNVSYISHVFYIDEGHVALSNQFMSKLFRNVLENPRLQAGVVHARTGQALVLDLMYERSETSGPLFEAMAANVTAVASHHGMESIMKLRSADIYRVLDVELQKLDENHKALIANQPRRVNSQGEAVALSLALSRIEELDEAIELVLDGLERRLGIRHCMVFLADHERGILTAIASRGYSRQGVGAEVGIGKGVVGIAAEAARSLRFSCVGRHALYMNNVRAATLLSPDTSREIPMPGLDAAQSMLAVPMIAGGEVRGVIFAESEDRLAFSPSDEQAVSLIAVQLGSVVGLAESSREREAALSPSPAQAKSGSAGRKTILVQHYAHDDSVFINHEYVIKGVPGRLLWRMLQIFEKEGRTEFTNREFRLDTSLKLPEFKDNLETRLLLLARRLAESNWPVRVLRSGRGRVELNVDGPLSMTQNAVR
jgi:adenylate cyclase